MFSHVTDRGTEHGKNEGCQSGLGTESWLGLLAPNSEFLPPHGALFLV